MGNLLTAMVTIMSPLITKEYLIPTFMHPYRWGGVPFEPPGPFKYGFLYLLFNLLIIGTMATISGMMTTARECRKMSFWTSVVNARWALIFALIGIIFVAVFSFLKAPVLALLAWMPYSNLIVTGLYMAPFVLIGGMIGNGYNRKNVCYQPYSPG
jgi:hypothetical protein